KRASFDSDALFTASVCYTDRNRVAAAEAPIAREIQLEHSDEVLVVANGPSIQRHGEGVRQSIERRRPLVLECNTVPELAGLARVTVVLNAVRMHELVASFDASEAQRRIATGLAAVPAEIAPVNLFRVPYRLEAGRLDISGRELVIPSF